MIRDIKELENYLLADAEDLGGIEENPECDLLLIVEKKNYIESRIEEINHLPQSYLDCLLKYNVFRVCIGYFSISPISYDVDNIIDSLLLAQKESFLPHNIIDPLDLYWVGNNNNDTIYVAGKNSPKFKEGEVIAIHEFILKAKPEEYDRYFLTLAKDFEQFMILAGNLNEVHRFSKDRMVQKNELERRLKELGVDERYAECWYEYI